MDTGEAGLSLHAVGTALFPVLGNPLHRLLVMETRFFRRDALGIRHDEVLAIVEP